MKSELSQGRFKATGAAVGNKTFALVSAAKLWGRHGLFRVIKKKGRGGLVKKAYSGAKCEQDVRAAGGTGSALIPLLTDDALTSAKRGSAKL